MASLVLTGMTPAMDRATARLRPLRLALFVSGIAPWLPVEKVFMTELGFTPALVAVMATAYAAVVPLLEIPAGILADRWSRRGVLMLAHTAALAGVVVGALSHGVVSYIVSAMILGVFFAFQSGTVDAIVYDTLLEETGTAEGYEAVYGRFQMWSSAALTGSALAGGAIAAFTSSRDAYLLTIPFALAGIVLLLRLREPTLHRRVELPGIRAHLLETGRAVRTPRVALIVCGSVLGAAALQMTFEFGPLWLLAIGTATLVFGPYTAGMTATLGLGGRLAAWLRLDRRAPSIATTILLVAAGLSLTAASSTGVVIAGQVTLAAILAAIGIHLPRLLHDAVPSQVRTGVSSGAATLSWLTFLPCSMIFGALSQAAGIHTAGWVVAALTAGTGAIVIALARRSAVPASGDGRSSVARRTAPAEDQGAVVQAACP
ncbi:MAG TPA: MFS transporter [Pseudonocardia sp.]